MNANPIFDDLRKAVVEIDENQVDLLITTALEAGVNPLDIINNGLTPGLEKVGDLFADEQLFLPELVFAGEVVTKAVERLKGSLTAGAEAANKGKIILATVEGDVHDIGKNLVALLLTASGYQVVDLGKDVAVADIVAATAKEKPDAVGLSSLLSTTMPAQKKSIDALAEAGFRDSVKVLVGGAPVSRAWAEEIGADGFAQDATAAVGELEKVLSRR